MQSNFEWRSQLEQRWAQKNATARRTTRASVIRLCLVWLALPIAIIAGGVFALRHFGINFGLTKVDRTRIDAFADAFMTFNRHDILPWRSAPQEVRPGHAPNGFTYRMLVEKKGGVCGIYEMVANGKGGVSVCELTPMGKPIKVTLADFKKAKADGIYLTICGEKAYVCGADTADAGIAFYRRLSGRR